jgi:hypothetical protein
VMPHIAKRVARMVDLPLDMDSGGVRCGFAAGERSFSTL